MCMHQHDVRARSIFEHYQGMRRSARARRFTFLTSRYCACVIIYYFIYILFIFFLLPQKGPKISIYLPSLCLELDIELN